MNDFDPLLNPAAPPPTSRERLEAALSAIVDQYGPSLFFEPDRLKAYLDDACPDAPKGISLVLLALAEEVPQQLLASHSDSDLNALLPRLVQHLIERSMFDLKSATWVVRTWTHALALPTTGLDGVAQAAVPPAPPVAVDFASIVTPMTQRRPATPPRASVAPAAVLAAPVQPEATPPAMDIELHARSEAEPPVMPAAAPAAMDAGVPTPAVAESSAVPEATPRAMDFAMRAPVEEIAQATSRPDAIEVDASSTSASLAAPVEHVAPMVEAASTEKAADAVTASSETPVTVETPEAPPAARAVPPEASPTEIAAIVVAPAVEPIVVPPASPSGARPPEASGVAAARKPVPHGAAGANPGPGARSSRGRSIAIGIAVVLAVVAAIAFSRKGSAPSADDGATAVARNDTPAATAPALPARPATTTGVSATETAPQATAMAPEKTVAATSTNAAPPLVAVSQTPSAAPEGTAAAAAPGPTSEVATSTPAVAAPVSTISRIDVPRTSPGRPVVLAIHVDPASSGHLAFVERRVLDGSAPVRSTPVSSLVRSRSGALLYPLDASDRAPGSTLQFTLVDREGRRGPARRVALRSETGGAPATVAECTRATCGSVVAVREAGKVYETIVRMDDRSIHTVAEPSRWRTGARVRMTGNQFALVAADRR